MSRSVSAKGTKSGTSTLAAKGNDRLQRYQIGASDALAAALALKWITPDWSE